MNGLSSVVGVGPIVEFGGKEYTVKAKMLEQHAIVEAQIVKNRGNPFDMFRAAAESFSDNPDGFAKIVPIVMSQAKGWKIVTFDEVREYLNSTLEGMALSVWMAIRHNNPEKLTISYVKETFVNELESRIQKDGDASADRWWRSLVSNIEQAEGVDELGNSTGSPRGEAESQTVESPGT